MEVNASFSFLILLYTFLCSFFFSHFPKIIIFIFILYYDNYNNFFLKKSEPCPINYFRLPRKIHSGNGIKTPDFCCIYNLCRYIFTHTCTYIIFHYCDEWDKLELNKKFQFLLSLNKSSWFRVWLPSFVHKI